MINNLTSKKSLALLIAVSTFLISIAVSFKVNGIFFSTVSIVDLSFLGVTHENLIHFEWWRLVTAQLIHVKWPHMVFNTIYLFLLGRKIEELSGVIPLLSLWILGGGIATYFSSLFVPPPWNVGTGASQAVLAFSVYLLALSKKNATIKKPLLYSIVFYISISIILDLIFVHYPKPGHVLSMTLGFLFFFIFRPKK